jgi:hypothetical protein
MQLTFQKAWAPRQREKPSLFVDAQPHHKHAEIAPLPTLPIGTVGSSITLQEVLVTLRALESTRPKQPKLVQAAVQSMLIHGDDWTWERVNTVVIQITVPFAAAAVGERPPHWKRDSILATTSVNSITPGRSVVMLRQRDFNIVLSSSLEAIFFV